MVEAADKDAFAAHRAEVLRRLQSLLDSASRVEILKGKWMLIASKLAALQARLAELSVPVVDYPLSSELMTSIAATCAAGAALAEVCRSPTPPGGKLKTQNDVDSLSAEIDAHISDLDVTTKTGVASEGASGKRDSVRAETRNLMTRLQIGSTESRSSALDSLLGLLQEDDKNVLIAVAQGILPVLVHLLDSSFSYEIKEKTVTAIAKISSLDSSNHFLLNEGLVLLNGLMRALESGSVFAKEKSCIALTVLSTSKENARAIGSRGGISSLLEVCQEGTPNSQALAAGVLRNLAVFEEIKENFIEENAILILLSLCNSGTALAQENALGCLNNLISEDDELKLFVAKEGGIESVKNLWDSAANPQNLEVAVQMAATLATCQTAAEFMVSDGFVVSLVGVLSSGVLGARIAAAKALSELSSHSHKTVKELGELGAIPLLLTMLEGKAEEKNSAAKLLSVLMFHSGNRRIYRRQEKNIAATVKLLDPSSEGTDKTHLVRILASVAHHRSSRKQMVSVGACVYLQALDVEGAKKLHESLRRGRPWRGVFARGG